MPIKLTGAAVAAGMAQLEVVKGYTVGEDIPAGSVVALRDTDGKIYQAQASSWSRMPAIGVIQEDAVTDEEVDVYHYTPISDIRRTEDFTARDRIFVSTEAGKGTKTFPQTIGHIVQCIGYALDSSDIALTVWKLWEEIDHTAIEIGG